MALPKIAIPEYTVKLFSKKDPVKYRPYLVGEEKLLMMAMTGSDAKDVEAAVQQLIRECTFGAIDPTKLPSFDVEYLFLVLRSKSVNNVVDTKYRCLNKVTTDGIELECGGMVPVQINLDDIHLKVPEGHTDLVWLTDDMGIQMQYPVGAVDEQTDLETLLPLCIKSVVTKAGDVYELADQSKAEVDEFIKSLTMPMVNKLNVFFDTMPRLEHTFDFKCSTCGYSELVTLRGLMDFFD